MSTEIISGGLLEPIDALLRAAELNPLAVFAGLTGAAALGSAHSLAPGHGKTLVAGYLVGGNARLSLAVKLALIVTITHTSGILLLGLGMSALATTDIAERLDSVIELVAGMVLAGVGFGMIWRRARGDDAHGHDHGLDGHGHGHGHDHGHAHHHDNGGLGRGGVLALGITGGALPCPSAVVIMLGAIALGRPLLGFALVVAFSVGLAASLTILGSLAVLARDVLVRSADALGASRLRWGGASLVGAVFVCSVGILFAVSAAPEAIVQLRDAVQR